MIWKRVPQKRHQVGPFVVDYLREGDRGEGGHEVALPDGRRLRVLPDGTTTAQKRRDRIVGGLTELQSLPPGSVDPITYLVGCMYVLGASNYEILGQTITPQEIITDCLADWGKDLTAEKVIGELAAAGYTITTEAAV